MSRDKSLECIVNNPEKRLIEDIQDLDECQLRYKQDNTGIDILFYARVS